MTCNGKKICALACNENALLRAVSREVSCNSSETSARQFFFFSSEMPNLHPYHWHALMCCISVQTMSHHLYPRKLQPTFHFRTHTKKQGLFIFRKAFSFVSPTSEIECMPWQKGLVAFFLLPRPLAEKAEKRGWIEGCLHETDYKCLSIRKWNDSFFLLFFFVLGAVYK